MDEGSDTLQIHLNLYPQQSSYTRKKDRMTSLLAEILGTSAEVHEIYIQLH